MWILRHHPAFLTPARLPLVERLVREGAWWDLVDELAAHALGPVLLHHRVEVTAEVRRWGEDPNLWVRRAAILAQLQHRAATALLLGLIAHNAGDSDFFMRKAIGWALRQHARVDPEAVRRWCDSLPLSPLSRREALKHL